MNRSCIPCLHRLITTAQIQAPNDITNEQIGLFFIQWEAVEMHCLSFLLAFQSKWSTCGTGMGVLTCMWSYQELPYYKNCYLHWTGLNLIPLMSFHWLPWRVWIIPPSGHKCPCRMHRSKQSHQSFCKININTSIDKCLTHRADRYERDDTNAFFYRNRLPVDVLAQF